MQRPANRAELTLSSGEKSPDSAATPAELESALRDARGVDDRPAVIVVETNREPGVPAYDSWWDVPVAEVSGSERVRAARRQYDVDRQRTRRFL